MLKHNVQVGCFWHESKQMKGLEIISVVQSLSLQMFLVYKNLETKPWAKCSIFSSQKTDTFQNRKQKTNRVVVIAPKRGEGTSQKIGVSC